MECPLCHMAGAEQQDGQRAEYWEENFGAG